MKTSIVFRVIIGFILVFAAIGAASRASAVEGFVIAAHYELPDGKLGNIHDASTPGKLMRYDIKDDKLTASKVLNEKDGVGCMCISPFGDRVAFTKPNGMLAVIDVNGGSETDLVSFIGDDKVKADVKPATGLQWPASEGGKWIYYLDARNEGKNNALRRVNVESRADELVIRFNRSASGGFALSLDATPHSGKFIKRTDNYAIAIYDLAKGDGDMFNCPRTTGCGESISPDGVLLTANSGSHTSVNLVNMAGDVQQEFRLSQWDGDPCNPSLGKKREEIEWAWQAFRWSVNSINWIAVHQGKLKLGSTHETYFQDAMLYDWVNKRQINVTHNSNGKFERVGGFWENSGKEQFLGFFGGKAPFTIDLKDVRMSGEFTWDFGDGSAPAAGASCKHTYEKEGLFTLKATQGERVFKAQAKVLRRTAPTATATYVNSKCLLVDFSETVRGDALQVKLASGIKVESSQLSESGRRLTVFLAEPMKSNDALSLTGVSDLAQIPNSLADKPIDIAIPDWPSNRADLQFIWEDGKTLNAVADEKGRTVKELRVSRDAGQASLDRYGRMRPAKGRFSTGFFAQGGAKEQFGELVKAEAFTLEATIQSDDLKQKSASPFPLRIVNVSAWHDGDWSFMLGQQEDRLLFSIRTTDNFLNLDGKPVKSDLHGRAPVIEIAQLPDLLPHHVVITYMPGKFATYMDGKLVKSEEVKGSLMVWNYGELCFGDNHNGGRHGWLGKIEGVAIYKRVLDSAEVQRNFESYLKKRQSRKVLPQVEVEAALVDASQIPEPKRIAPYRDGLVINEYEIKKVGKTASDWKFSGKIEPGTRIRVAQWGIIEAKTTDLSKAKVGEVRPLVLEVYRNHPEKLEDVVTSNTLDLTADLPLLYEPRP